VVLLGPYSTAIYNNSVVLGDSSMDVILAGSYYQAAMYMTGIYTGSDKRFKSNIRALNNPIEKLKNIEGKKYENRRTGATDIGVIAQNLKEVFPELVQEMPYKDGQTRFVVNYQGLVPVLVEAVKEQQIIIEGLQTKVDEIDELKEELESLKQLIINNN